MGKMVHRRNEYIIIEDDRRKNGYVIINTLGKYEHHGHLKKMKTAKLVINLMEKHIVPDSDYLRGAVLRISLDEKYIEKVKHKIEKDKNKSNYTNINKGVMRK